MFHGKIENVLLRGLGVIAVHGRQTPLPDKLQRRAALTLPLARISAAMLSAPLCEIHGAGSLDLALSDPAAAMVEDLDPAAVFAAASPEDAQAQLPLVTAPETPTGQIAPRFLPCQSGPTKDRTI